MLPHPWFRAMCVSGAVVGAVSVSPVPERCRGEPGYVLARAYWEPRLCGARCGTCSRTWRRRGSSAWRRRPGSAARACCAGTTGTRDARGTCIIV